MATQTICAGMIGGLGIMASPMAGHWANGPVKIVRVHDRGNVGEFRDNARAAWRAHGAQLVPEIAQLVDTDLDGVFVCCGKNGDDLNIISETATLLASRKPGAFLCHMSTVSAEFAIAAESFCRNLGIRYVNYPLTGGSKGAVAGKLLILCAGERELFDLLSPALSKLGTPKYFGARPESGAEVKFMSHLMVFGGLMGLSSAVALHSDALNGGAIGGESQSEFFDFLNGGAGGTKQWDMSVGFGIKQDIWNTAFAIRYAAVDAIYTAQLCHKRALSRLAIDPVIRMILAFSYILNHVDKNAATQSVLREMIPGRAAAIDDFIARHYDSKLPVETLLARCADSLPADIRPIVALQISPQDFMMDHRQQTAAGQR